MEQFINFLDKYSYMIGSVHINPMVLCIVAGIILFMYLIRIFIGVTVNKQEAKEQKKWKQFLAYWWGHEGICYLFAVAIAIFMIIITGNQEKNMVLNFFLSPVVGFLGSIRFGIYISEHSEALSNPLKKKKEAPAAKADPSQSVSIVINNNNNEEGKSKSLDDNIDGKKITEDEVNDKGVVYFINELKENQAYLNEKLIKNSEEMKSQSEVLEALRKERIEEKGIQIEELIYNALVKGFATPAEDKLIRKKYYIYHEILGGNHGIQELYDNKYQGIAIHEERRKHDIPVDKDRRKQ